MQVESTKFVKSSIILRSISRKNAVKLVELYHYSHAIPANCSLFLGVYFNSILSGCICFGESVGRRMKEIVLGTKRGEYLELVRLALSPKMPKNSESRTIAVAIKLIRKRYTYVKWLVSFADENENHLGIIYQATNWLYTGKGGGTYLFTKGGKKYHQRNIAEVKQRYELTNDDLIKKGFEIKRLKPKHRYMYFIHKDQFNNFTGKVYDYPKNI